MILTRKRIVTFLPSNDCVESKLGILGYPLTLGAFRFHCSSCLETALAMCLLAFSSGTLNDSSSAALLRHLTSPFFR